MPTTCTPQSLYGPYYQTRFCGASIMSFSVSAGWNEQTSELTVDLVEDCSTTNKRIEYGVDLEASVVTDADEFSQPHVGSAVYFRVGDELNESGEYVRNPEGGFEFTGLIQSWNRKNDTSGNPTYSVKLTDPRVILDQSHIIVSDLGEDVFVAPPDSNRGLLAVPNVINAYGWLEGLDADCRNSFGTAPTYINSVAVGSLTGGFGGADVNNRGMRWNLLKKALGILLASDQIPYVITRSPYGRRVSTDGYSPYGRLLYRGGGNKQSAQTPGKTLLPGSGVLGPTPEDGTGRRTSYIVDLTEIPFSPDHYRITGPTLTFTELITQVCEAAGCDYYVELLPVKGLGGINLVIKVRVVQRREQPKLGEIQDYVDNQNFVISKTFGQELANQPNSIFIFGAKRQDYVQQDTYPYIVPSGGLDTDGLPIRVFFGNLGAEGSTNQWWYLLDFRQIEGSLNNSFTENYSTNGFAWVSESEIRCASVDRDIWREFVVSRLGDSRSPCTRWMLNWETLTGREFTPLMGPGAVIGTNESPDTVPVYRADMERMHGFIQTFATTFYGRRWLVNIPGVCRDYNFEAADASGFRPAPYYSDDPSTDGGWPTIANVLGLTMPSSALDFFALDETGKIGPMLRFSTAGMQATELDTGSFIATAGNLYVKARMQPRWVVGTPDFSNNTESAWAELEINAPVTFAPANVPAAGQRRAAVVIARMNNRFQANIDGSIDLVTARAWAGTLEERLERSIFTGFIPDRMLPPVQAGVPLVSKSRCYGPWGNLARATVNNDLYNTDELISGKLNVVHDDGFAPWEYGSYTLMNEAAESAVELSITEMQVAERGQVSVPGYPNKRIGSALNTTDTSAYNMILSPDNYGDFVFFKVDLLPPEGIKNTAASISNVNVNISTQGVQTEYTLSTFTPVFGRFAKSNADSLKRLGQLRLRVQRGFRAAIGREGGQEIGGGAALFNRARRQFGPWTPRSASPWLAGVLKRPGAGMIGTSRKEVVVQQSNDQMFYDSFNEAAIMSMDGLLRPVSKDGGGGGGTALPKYASSVTNCSSSFSVAPGPPQSGVAPSSIMIKDLDPFANPYSVDSTTISIRDGAGTYGHDIEDVARSNKTAITNQSGGPSGMINVQDAVYHGLNPGYTSDYRFLALRGPLMLQSWGYDLQGFPVPNSADSSQVPNTSYANLTNNFSAGWLQNSKNWPVAPLDLRFDRRRGVWTTPPAFGMYTATVNGAIAAGQEGKAVLTDGNTDDPQNITGGIRSITGVINKGDKELADGTNIFAYYDTEACKYWAIPTAGGSGAGTSIIDRPYCTPTGTGGGGYNPTVATGSGGNCSPTDCLVLGWGLQADYDPTGTEISAPFYVGNARSEDTKTDMIGVGAGLVTQEDPDGNDGCAKTLAVNLSSECGATCSESDRDYCPATGVLGFKWGEGFITIGAVGQPSEHVPEIHKKLEFEEKTGPLKKVGDVISHVNLGCGLKLDEGDEKCETSAKISITNEEAYHDPSPATAVTVACGIKCSADGIEVTEKKIWFSSCGLFLGTSVEDDSISYNADVPCRSTNAQLAQTPIQTEAAP